MPTTLFIDFDSFFASCEQQLQPALRGKPVGIVPALVDSSCCIAASYEAKAHGVKTGTGVREARMLCPSIVLTEARPRNYVEIHNKAKNAIEKCIHIEEVLSIDEVWGRLPRHWQSTHEIEALIARTRRTLAKAIGQNISFSAGAGPNLFLAKMGSKMNKPRGLKIIRREDLPDVLHTLELEDIHGIGRRMHQHLRKAGITTVRQLCTADRTVLREVWGSIEGDRMYARLRGEPVELPETTRRNVGHEHIMAPYLRNEPGAISVLHRLMQKACLRLREMDYYARRMSIYVKCMRGMRWTDEARFFETHETAWLTHVLNTLWERRPDGLYEPMKVAITFSDLLPARLYTPPLLPHINNARRAKAEAAMDTINKRFGPRSVYYGAAHGTGNAAPMRISFKHVPDLVTERDDGEILDAARKAQLARQRERAKW